MGFARIGQICDAVRTVSAVRVRGGERFPGEPRDGFNATASRRVRSPCEGRRAVWPEGVLGFRVVETDVDEAVGVFGARCVEYRAPAEPIAGGYGLWALFGVHWMIVFGIRPQRAALGTG